MKHFLELLKNASKETLEMSVDNCHAEGLFSLVIGGNENGELTRAFIAKKKIKPYAVQLHTHRYNLSITVLAGSFLHHTAKRTNAYGDDFQIALPRYKYTSPLNEGFGLVYDGQLHCHINSAYLPAGSTINHITAEDIHTVSCSAGTIWIVEELGFKEDFSYVYGKNFSVDNLYLKPSQSQINMAMRKLKITLNSFIEV